MTFARNYTEQKERREREKAATMAALCNVPTVARLHRGNYGPAETKAEPKHPSTRSANLRKLANREMCCGCLGLVCDPATTVWAHANGLADNKGRGYKSHDHLGSFLGAQCHKRVDERDNAEDAAQLFALAQTRTHQRLREIAANPMLKPWKVETARWALQHLNATPEAQ